MPNPAPHEDPTATPEQSPEEQPETAPEGDEQPGEEAPPWGDDFDPARAWKTIQNLRKVEKEHQKMLSDRGREAREREDAEKTEVQKASEALEAARKDANAARLELWTERAARRHALPDDLLPFLTGDSEETIEEKAQALAKYAAKREDPEEPTPPAGRPKPSLTPGESSGAPLPPDPKAVAKKVRERRGY